LLYILGAAALPGSFEADLARAEQTARARLREEVNFWNRAAVYDCKLVDFLATGRDYESSEIPAREIGEGYRRGKRASASPKEMRAVVERLDFLDQVLGRVSDKGKCVHILTAIQTIKSIAME